MSISRSPAPHRRRARRAGIALLAAVAAATSIVVPVQAARDSDNAGRDARPGGGAHTAVHGVGGGRLDFEGFEDDPVTFRIHGRTTEKDNPLSVQGTFHVTHERPDGSPFADLRGELDCLWVGGDVAVATGVIDDFDIPGFPELDVDGRRVGFTISDQGRGDRIGWSWAVMGFDEDAPLCMSTAPFFELEHGGFTVRD